MDDRRACHTLSHGRGRRPMRFDDRRHRATPARRSALRSLSVALVAAIGLAFAAPGAPSVVRAAGLPPHAAERIALLAPTPPKLHDQRSPKKPEPVKPKPEAKPEVKLEASKPELQVGTPKPAANLELAQPAANLSKPQLELAKPPATLYTPELEIVQPEVRVEVFEPPVQQTHKAPIEEQRKPPAVQKLPRKERDSESSTTGEGFVTADERVTEEPANPVILQGVDAPDCGPPTGEAWLQCSIARDVRNQGLRLQTWGELRHLAFQGDPVDCASAEAEPDWIGVRTAGMVTQVDVTGPDDPLVVRLTYRAQLGVDVVMVCERVSVPPPVDATAPPVDAAAPAGE